MSTEKNILIAGANGTTGRIIVDLLKESAHYRPIAMVREIEQKDRFENENVTAVLADLEGDLSQALAEIKFDKVIFAAGSKGKNIEGVDQEGAKRLIDVAKGAGVEKFVMLSSMGADDPSQNADMEDYLRAKQNADNYLQASGLDYVIVRPGHLSNEDGKGTIVLGNKLSTKGSISRSDVARTLVEVLHAGGKQNQVFEILEGETAIEQAVQSK